MNENLKQIVDESYFQGAFDAIDILIETARTLPSADPSFADRSEIVLDFLNTAKPAIQRGLENRKK